MLTPAMMKQIEQDLLSELIDSKISRKHIIALKDEVTRLWAVLAPLRQARPIASYHEDRGNVLWWKFPIDEPPYCGTPSDSDWPGYHTHWTPLPPLPREFL
jgi:hypothetical protein